MLCRKILKINEQSLYHIVIVYLTSLIGTTDEIFSHITEPLKPVIIISRHGV